MPYLLEYVLHRTKTDAPEFLKYIMISFLIKMCVLTIFLPFDLIYIIKNYRKFKNKIHFIIFSEKYKSIGDKLNGSVGIITHPTVNLYLNKNSNILYIPASIYFLLTAVSLLSGRIIAIPFFQLNSEVLILHTDALMVPRYLLRVQNYKYSFCIQHGEFRSLNKIYDGQLCSHNIVMGDDQAQLFIAKNYQGDVYIHRQTMNNLRTTSVDSIVLVGQGLHVNNRRQHRIYQEMLKKLYIKCKNQRINIYYRPHPAEKFWNYWYFLGKTEKNIKRDEFSLSSVYVGLESTLLRQVKANGGHADLLNRIDVSEYSKILSSEKNKKSKMRNMNLDAQFLQFATEIINDYA